MNWTKKHDKFALACNLSESQGYVLRDILRKGKLNEPTQVEIDLRVTNSWIGKVRARGAYHRKTITTTIAQLDEKTQGMVTMLKRYNPWVYKILVTPLAFVERISCAKRASTPKLATGKPMFSEDHKQRLAKQQQQDISKLDNLLSSVGLKFTSDNLLKLWRMAGKSWSEVTTAVEYLLHANSTQKTPIGNAHGFLVDSFKYGWHKGFNLYYQATLPIFESASAISNFVAQIIKPDLIKCQI